MRRRNNNQKKRWLDSHGSSANPAKPVYQREVLPFRPLGATKTKLNIHKVRCVPSHPLTGPLVWGVNSRVYGIASKIKGKISGKAPEIRKRASADPDSRILLLNHFSFGKEPSLAQPCEMPDSFSTPPAHPVAPFSPCPEMLGAH